MKIPRFALTFVAALVLALPPSIHAEEVCNVYTFRYNGFYEDCLCWACGGWAYHNCTECYDPATGSACQTNGTKPCPVIRQPM